MVTSRIEARELAGAGELAGAVRPEYSPRLLDLRLTLAVEPLEDDGGVRDDVDPVRPARRARRGSAPPRRAARRCKPRARAREGGVERLASRTRARAALPPGGMRFGSSRGAEA